MESTLKAPADVAASTGAGRKELTPCQGFSNSNFTTKRRYITAHEIAEDCGIAKSTAYTLIRAMNAELREMGKITISGKVPRAFMNLKHTEADNDSRYFKEYRGNRKHKCGKKGDVDFLIRA